MERYDLIVIGAGPGGYVAAIRAAQLGMSVACVDPRPAPGGTCLHVGCIPSKALLESSQKLAEARESLAEHGVRVGEPELDLGAMQKRKDKVVKTLTRGVGSLFKKNKVTWHRGVGRLAGGRRVAVEGTDGSTTELEGERVLLAPGSVPATPGKLTPDGERVVTSTEALSFDAVPEHLVVIGGGYIGVELGSVWARLGARVTVVEALERILTVTDAEMAAEAQKRFEKQGLAFRLGTAVSDVKAQKTQARVDLEDGETIRCDRVLVAVGRRPNTDDVGLEAAGIERDERGFIPVDADYATAAEGIHAVGDAVGEPMLAHKAEEEGIACVEKLATGYGHVNYGVIPAVVFTHPEIASVGRTEEQLKEEGVDYKRGDFPFAANGRARAIGDADGSVKVLADARTDRVLGVHILGPDAGELIAEAAAAMSFGASSEDIARTCHTHPTLSESVKEAALDVAGHRIHA